MTRDWGSVKRHYESLLHGEEEPRASIFRSMAELCEWIETSPLSEFLHPVTSLSRLGVYQVSLDYSDRMKSQVLNIDPLFDENLIEFRFVDTIIDDKQWCRIEAPRSDHLKKRLIGFVRQVGWVNDTIELIVD